MTNAFTQNLSRIGGVASYSCRYHPLENAVWMHSQTNDFYCSRCVDRDEDAELPGATSIVGGEPLQYLGSAGDAPLFWNELANYLVFPFRWQILLWWLPLWGLCSALLANGGVAQWVGAGIALAGVSHLGLAILSVTGDGQALERMRTEAMSIKPDALLALLLAQVIPVAALVAVDYYSSGFLNHIVFLGVAVFLPSVMLVAWVEQSGGLTSPQRWLDMINGVGWSYILVVGFFVLVAGVDGIAYSLFYGELPDSLSLPLLLGVLMYSLIVSYRLLGGVVHQFQRGVGFLPQGKPLRKRSRQLVDRGDQTIEMLVKDARFTDLEQYLRQLIKQRPQTSRYQDLLGKLLIEKGDDLALRQHADQMLEALIKNEDTSRLLFVYGSQCALIKDYKPSSPGVRFSLAQLQAAKGEHESAARMLVNMHNEHPQYPGLGDAYWFLAKLLAEELGQPELAAQCAMFVYKTFPKHTEREKIELFLKSWRQRKDE